MRHRYSQDMHLAQARVAGPCETQSRTMQLGCLWILAEPGRMRMAIAIMATRFALLTVALVLAAVQGARPLLAMAAGILVARVLVMHRVRAAV